jgi:hypothetical protein
MPRDNNFLIGHGENLTSQVVVPKGGNSKNMPYDFPTMQQRISSNLETIADYIQAIPQDACPKNETVTIITMHPRFVSKSDFPVAFLNSVGLRALGSRPQKITPDRWGIERHPDSAQTEQIFAAGKREVFYNLARELRKMKVQENAAQSLLKIESISPFVAETKIKAIPINRENLLLEVLLHNANDEGIIRAFINYVYSIGAKALVERKRDEGGITFIPIDVSRGHIIDIARFSFVRVCRGMPTIRPFFPGILRYNTNFSVVLPSETAIEPNINAVIFDGGIPDVTLPALSNWVSLTEPSGIGAPVPACQMHGLAVTSSFLFGSLSNAVPVDRPICKVDHVRVMDQRDAASSDIQYLDVIDRITNHLDANPNKYKFINLSLGPDIPITDDEISYWTIALDRRFSSSGAVVTVAVGNNGEYDANSGLNRVQPPSDAVNVLSVGACDISDSSPITWNRAAYSAVGPGRSPGIVKPDGLAFGGSIGEPFYVLNSHNQAGPIQGTSFAAPLSLRSTAAIAAECGDSLNPLTIRALMIHCANDGNKNRSDVRWGRFELDPEYIITCPDDSPTIIYQGELPIGRHLRAPVPLPTEIDNGLVTITATLLIAPEVDTGFLGTYTESGFEVIFRKHSQKFTQYPDGRISRHPTSTSFFCEGGMYGQGEYALREGGIKWEPCLKRSRTFRSNTLFQPCFDIFYINREEGLPKNNVRPIPYSLLITINAPKVPDLYNQIVRNYNNILIPIQPRLRVHINT